ncbi:MAG: Fic family protein [Gemmatimonadota bacterium]|nr:Fic family protein [Gemmatimonadota bacterium]
MSNVIDQIDRLKAELDALRPLPSDVLGRVEQKLRIESNYHSNAIEGNSLTLGETRSLILHGLTAHGKPMRDHLDIEGHDEAVKAMEDAVNRDESLNEVFIRNLHEVLLKKPYEIDAITLDGQPSKRQITIGRYKTQPNNVRTSTGEIYYFTAPDQVKPAMSDLIDWYRRAEYDGEHPIFVAATFHYRFVRIHPFDDGNGRMARLLMNMILIKHGYTVAIIPIQERNRYISTLEKADKSEDLSEFIECIAEYCKNTLSLHLRAARGESVEDVEDIDKEIELFKRSIQTGNGELIRIREYADSVLYPFFNYCNEKCEQFSGMFENLHVISSDSSVRCPDNQIRRFRLEKRDDAWPDDALLVSTSLGFWLTGYQAKKGIGFEFDIENEAHSKRCVWSFRCRDLDYEEQYFGQNLEELKKIFNSMIRQMIMKLSDIRDGEKDEV